ncbi:hypothetical protein EBZ80_20940 [bacterium]|nr:hypothetical protein [bacterium]
MPEIVVQGTAAIQVSVSPGLGASVVVNGTATSIVGTAGINPFIAGANITITTTGGGITVIGRNPPVYSVQGMTGTVVLTPATISAANLVHSHSTSDIDLFTTAARLSSPVQSVAGRTGIVTITTTDVAAFTAASPVQSVAGRTGVVSLTTTDIASFTTSARLASPVQSVAGRTGTITLTTTDIALFTTAARLASPVQSVAGKTGEIVLSHVDISAAAATHTHSYVSSLNSVSGAVTLSQGQGISITVNGNSVQISASAQPGEVSAVLWPAFILGG